MKYPIALTPYLNTRPYFYHQAPGNFALLAMSPRESVPALAGGHAIAGIVPVAGLERLKEEVDLLGEFGIASEGPVRSVLFFSRRPFAAFTRDCQIRLSRESLTSVQLLALLFGYQIGFANLPWVIPENAVSDGELLIGDDALSRFYKGDDRYVTDLSEQWTRYHHCPFVFARWVIRKDAHPELREQLQQWLDTFVRNEDHWKQVTAGCEAGRYAMTTASVFNYLQGITTRIGRDERLGQALYFDELEKYRPAFPDSSPAKTRTYARR